MLTKVVKMKGIRIGPFICGNANLRLQARKEGEVEAIGPYVYGRGIEYAKDMHERQNKPSNRKLWVDFLLTNKYVLPSTYSKRTHEKTVTLYGKKGFESFCE